MSARLQEFARQIESAQRSSRAEKHREVWHPTATPASSIGYHCERRLVYLRVMPEAAERPGEELSSIFEEGHHHEAQVKRELSELGFEVLDGQTQFDDKRLDLRGHIDGRLRTPWGTRVPVEMKSFGGEGPHSEAEWRDNPTPLLRRYFDQLSLYLYLTGQEEGLGLFKNKQTGLWAIPAIGLDYAHVETLLKRAERVRDAVAAYSGPDSLPRRIPDRSECSGCPYLLTCLPADAPVDPLLIAQDEELAAQLVQREALEVNAATFDKLHDEIRTRFKLTKGDRFACGDFLITKKVNKAGAVSLKFERLGQSRSA